MNMIHTVKSHGSHEVSKVFCEDLIILNN